MDFSRLPQVCRCEACQLLSGGGCGIDGQQILSAAFLPVVQVVLQHIVSLHGTFKHRHEELGKRNQRGRQAPT